MLSLIKKHLLPIFSLLTILCTCVACSLSSEPQPERTHTPEQPLTPKEIVVETVAENLEVPWGMDFSPTGELFFTERPGRIRQLSKDGELISLADTAHTSEGGLLGLALHPNFDEEPYIYVYQTYQNSAGIFNRILRLRYDEQSRSLDDRTVIFDGIPGASHHDGGQLTIGPDKKLYVTTGDANRAETAQNPELLSGKILRLNLDGTIPADNPFDSNSPVYSLGHRNPQGLAFHPETNALYSTEHGSSGLDELNMILPGKNYGWPTFRGLQHGNYEAPLQAYDPTIAPAAADFYFGPIAQWHGDLFFGTLSFTHKEGYGRHLRRVRLAEDGRTIVEEEKLFHNEFGRIRAVKSGPDGCLYFGTSNRDGRSSPEPNDDRILRICAVGEEEADVDYLVGYEDSET